MHVLLANLAVRPNNNDLSASCRAAVCNEYERSTVWAEQLRESASNIWTGVIAAFGWNMRGCSSDMEVIIFDVQVV